MKTFFFLFFISMSVMTFAQTPSSILVPDYGIINDLENVTDPDPNVEYKIVVDLKTKSPDPARINPGLNNIARMLNLHAAGGISSDNIKVIAAIHGNATYVVLDNVGYKKKYGVENPNLGLIDQLKDAGVDLKVCGQSLVARNNGFDNVNEKIDIALSMLTVVTEMQQKGYGLLVFN